MKEVFKIEEWKPIAGYEDIYEVSNVGNVRSLNRFLKCKNNTKRKLKGKPFSLVKQVNGYLTVTLSKNGKQKVRSVHRIVAESFIKNPKKYPIINHLNSNRHDNRSENLEWCTAKQNVQHGFKNGRVAWNKEKKCPQISESKKGYKNPAARKVFDFRTNKIYPTLTEASVDLGIPIGTLASRLRRDSKTNTLTYL